MPANLPPEYFQVEKKYRTARTTDEKIAVLRELLSIVPKHKGTEKLQKELKSKIARLKREKEERKAQGGRRAAIYTVRKEGAAQVALIGYPNAGKSQLLKAMTNAQPEVAPYPFTTFKPNVGMAEFEDIAFQLVDLPPISEEHIEYWVLDIVRNADLALLVVDLSDDDFLEQTRVVLEKLEERKIIPVGKGEAEIHVVGPIEKRTILVANKLDAPDADLRLEMLREYYGDKFPIVAVSAVEGRGLEELKRVIFRELEIIRVYTKEPGKPPDMSDPLILKKNSTVLDAAREIHKDFAEKLKYARLWGSSKFDGQRVEKTYILEDRDIVEFHI